MEFEFLSKVEQWIPSDFLFLITPEEKMLSLPGPPARDAKGLDTDYSEGIMSHSHQRIKMTRTLLVRMMGRRLFEDRVPWVHGELSRA